MYAHVYLKNNRVLCYDLKVFTFTFHVTSIDVYRNDVNLHPIHLVEVDRVEIREDPIEEGLVRKGYPKLEVS